MLQGVGRAEEKFIVEIIRVVPVMGITTVPL
jgi:hypothetical protein